MKTSADLDYEEVVRRAQAFIADQPVLILGSGATIPYGLPSMSQLAEHLVNNIETPPADWDVFRDRLTDLQDLELALQDTKLSSDTVARIINMTWDLVSDRDLRYYDSLLQNPTSFPLADLFRHLLRTTHAHVHVVTTNYDRVAEYAANYVKAYASTGVSAGWLQRFVSEAVNGERRPVPGFEGQVTILKVHGSLDWFEGPQGGFVSIPLRSSTPGNMKPLIVTPGASKYRKVLAEPFRTVLTQSDVVLREAECFVCIGFGFNDEHVQPKLVERVQRDNIPLLILARSLSRNARNAFLLNPPRKFLFFEEAPEGTRVYTSEAPDGVVFPDVSLWDLGEFMKLITGGEVYRYVHV